MRVRAASGGAMIPVNVPSEKFTAAESRMVNAAILAASRLTTDPEQAVNDLIRVLRREVKLPEKRTGQLSLFTR